MSPALDATIHPPARLRAMGLLINVSELEFGRLRDLIGVSDSVLSKHLAALGEAGYVSLRKAALDGRQRTWVTATRSGARAFSRHVAALTELAGGLAAHPAGRRPAPTAVDLPAHPT